MTFQVFKDDPTTRGKVDAPLKKETMLDAAETGPQHARVNRKERLQPGGPISKHKSKEENRE